MIEDAVILLLHIAILCVDILCTVIEILLLLLTEMRFLNFTTVSIYELRHDEPVLRQGPTQTGLYNHRRWLEA